MASILALYSLLHLTSLAVVNHCLSPFQLLSTTMFQREFNSEWSSLFTLGAWTVAQSSTDHAALCAQAPSNEDQAIAIVASSVVEAQDALVALRHKALLRPPSAGAVRYNADLAQIREQRWPFQSSPRNQQDVELHWSYVATVSDHVNFQHLQYFWWVFDELAEFSRAVGPYGIYLRVGNAQ